MRLRASEAGWVGAGSGAEEADEWSCFNVELGIAPTFAVITGRYAYLF